MRWFRSLLVAVLLMSCGPRVWAAPATQPATADVNLLSMGDWGMGNKDQRAVAAALANYASSSGVTFDGILLLGDNFYMKIPRGIEDPVWQNIFEKMYDPTKLNFPFFVALGNHDYLDGKDAIELEYAKAHPESRWKLPARWYRLDIPQQNPLVTVLMLDSDKDPLGEARWNEQKAWMESELSKPRGVWTICCAHHPLFSNGGHGDNGVMQKEWGPMFVKHNVDMYVCGHDHDLQHLQIPGWFTSFLLVGGGGADVKLMRLDDRGPLSRLTHGFAHLDFSPQSVTVKYIVEDGSILHEFTRDKSGKITVIVNGGEDKAAVNPLKALEGFGGYTPPAASQPADDK
jgi:tartrate-resistant acid phosphatase type 5